MKYLITISILLTACQAAQSVTGDGSKLISTAPTNWNTLLTKSCNADGVLEYGLDQSDAIYTSIGHSNCFRIARAVELWNNVPDVAYIKANLNRLQALSTPGKQFMFSAFLAESMSTKQLPAAYCQAGSIGHWGPETCIPDSSNLNYRAYLLQITADLIDAGIRDFEFGQLNMLDPGKTMGTLLTAMRAVAAAKGVTIIIGGQPNLVPVDDYLVDFDYVVGPMRIDSGRLYTDVTSGYDGSPNVWGPEFAAKTHVFIETDWYSPTDDIHTFVATADKKSVINFIKVAMPDIGFVYPVVVPLGNNEFYTWQVGADEVDFNQYML